MEIWRGFSAVGGADLLPAPRRVLSVGSKQRFVRCLRDDAECNSTREPRIDYSIVKQNVAPYKLR